MPNNDTPIYSISELNQLSKAALEQGIGSVWVTGEVSNFSQPRSGHCYFRLKDETAQIACALFRGTRMRLNFEIEDGMHILAQARVSLYEARGDYQLIINYAEPAGSGVLQKQFEALKAKLQAEGLFDTERKQALPAYPSAIGVITSATGAALRDILHVLQRRNPSVKVIVYPTSVQGSKAAGEIVAAIDTANARCEADVLMVARGGGSLEDLWPFNEEVVARAIAASELPIVAGVGHEVDFTIADFVADERAPTPSAAAEVVVPELADILGFLQHSEATMLRFMQWQLQQLTQRLSHATQRLKHPQTRLQELMQQLDDQEQRLVRAWQHRCTQWQQ